MVDRDPGRARVPVLELGEVGIGHSHVEPGPVVHRVADVRELPVDDPRDLPVLEHEVARTGVTLDQHGASHVDGSVRAQPRTGVAHEWIEVRHAVVGELRPHLEVETGVVLGVSWTRETVERECVDVEVVQRRERVDERHHRLVALGLVRPRRDHRRPAPAPSAGPHRRERDPRRAAPAPECARARGTRPLPWPVRSRCRRTSRRPRTAARAGRRRPSVAATSTK